MSSPGKKSPPNPVGEGPRTGKRKTGDRETDVALFDDKLWLGRVIDERYRIERMLGEGGMGAVFLAEHLKLQKKVALKIILPQFAGDGEIAERFAREAMASAKLDHPHVASALDYGTLPEGGAYLVMQYVRGRSLRAAAVEHAGDWRFACGIGAQIADALAAAHAAGIVHRDLKPDNVFLEPREGEGNELVRVLDFGIARVLDGREDARNAGRKQLTRVGTIIGTPGYMAPEQALGEEVDERADLYALGVVLWEILSGVPLFTEEDITAIVTRQLTTEAPRPQAEDIPLELESLVLRLLSRDRQARVQRATEVRDALRKLGLESELLRMSTSVNTSGALTILRDSGLNDGGREASGRAPVGREAVSSMARAGPAPGPASELSRGLPLQLVGLLALMMLGLGAMVLVAVVALVRTNDASSSVAVGPPPGPLAPSTPPRVDLPVGLLPPSETPETETPSEAAGGSAGLGEDFDTLLFVDERAARSAAATRILEAPEGGPVVARLLAELELAEGCNQKREALTAIRELGDARALPILDRLDDLPRRGCGFLGTGDCWRCIRRDIRRTRTALAPTAAPAP
jgi:serine/threonine protein kinase